MKTLPLLCAMVLLATAGCARHYVITLNNGTQIGAKGKPKLNENGMYVFKNAQGSEDAVAATRVTTIAPASQKPSKGKDQFIH